MNHHPMKNILFLYTLAPKLPSILPQRQGSGSFIKTVCTTSLHFVEQHPGGEERIMMAKGSNIDPFWNLYQQHLTPEVAAVLAKYKIGCIDPNEASPVLDVDDPYANEPERHPALHVHKAKPFNAETPIMLISDNYITPSALWFLQKIFEVYKAGPNFLCTQPWVFSRTR